MADRRLQVFQTVARLLSFTKAAQELHMTQPAVTFQVRQLEEHYNTRLFDRTHNRISLTRAGERVYEYAERITHLYEEMDNAVRELTGKVTGILMVGASTTIAEYMLPTLLGSFKEKYPEIGIRLKVMNSEAIVSMVENNTIDIGIVESTVNNKQLMAETCCMDELVLVVPNGHDLAGQEQVTLNVLLNYPFIAREEGSGTREVIMGHLEKNGIRPQDLNITMELGSSESIKGAVEAGMGISLLSQSTIAKELKLKTLVAVNLNPQLSRPFSFVYQRQKFRSRAVDELLAFSRDYCQSYQAADCRLQTKETL